MLFRCVHTTSIYLHMRHICECTSCVYFSIKCCLHIHMYFHMYVRFVSQCYANVCMALLLFLRFICVNSSFSFFKEFCFVFSVINLFLVFLEIFITSHIFSTFISYLNFDFILFSLPTNKFKNTHFKIFFVCK